MPSIHELFSERFARWERRGRGWQVFNGPVTPEPPFVPFPGGFAPPTPIDDGRRATALSSFIQRLSRKLVGEPQVEPPPAISEEIEPEPDFLERDPPVELQISLPRNFNPHKFAFEQFLQSISLCHQPLGFELLGLPGQISAQFAVDQTDVSLVRKQLEAAFPDVGLVAVEDRLAGSWTASDGEGTGIIEFGLAREFMFPLASAKLDPFVGIVAALAELKAGELGLFQVLFQRLHHPWSESVLNSVTDRFGKQFFVDAPELTKAAEQKATHPLYAAVVRIATRASGFDRAWDIARELACSLHVYAHPLGNELIPLRNDKYPFEAHEQDVLLRQSRRSGMILTAEELAGFVHLPSADVSKLTREITRTKAAPAGLQSGVLLGHNLHAGQTTEVRLSPEQRVRHTHIIGASGKGKSTLLINLIRQDIEAGQGLAVLDPHGDLIDEILGKIPEDRINDVIVFDPSDEKYSIGFNVLSAHSDLEKNLLASDLVSVFQRLSASWGDQMGSVLQNAILAFLESSRGGTLADLRRFLLETGFRNEFLKTVNDPEIVYYWQKAFPQLSGNKSIGSVLTRLETFLAPKPIRYMVSQQTNRLDFRNIMDTGKVFLAKLSQGQLGKENSFLLGSLLMAKFQQTAMGRQGQNVASRKLFWLYLDEFHNFITPTLAEILTGARKYGVGLIVAHQELRQLERDREVASAVLSNCYTRVVFGVGDDDARKLSDGFASFEARDLQNLSPGQAICRVERSDHDFNLSVPLPIPGDPAGAIERRERIITLSRENYGTPRAQIEESLRNAWQAEERIETKLPKASPSPEKSKAPALSTEVVVPSSRQVIAPPEPKPPTVLAKQGPTIPADMGIGGAQHRAIQQRIKREAETLGFLATIEKVIPHGSVDVLLERAGLGIACEISVTTTIDHEVGNVAKCLKAGFARIAVICQNEERTRQIRTALESSLGSEATVKVGYFSPDSFIAHLHDLPPPLSPIEISAAEKTRIRRGRKVTIKGPALSEAEFQDKENENIKNIAEVMRRLAASA